MTQSDLFPKTTTSDFRATGPIPPFRAVMELSAGAAAIWKTKRDRNTWYRLGWQGVGDHWINEYLALRFNRGYMSRVLGYQKGGKDPLLASGRFATHALAHAHAEARATTKTQRVDIRVPFGSAYYINYPINREGREALRHVPLRELAPLAKVLQRDLILAAQGATISVAKRGTTAGQARASFKAAGATANIMQRIERKRSLDAQFGLRPSNLRQTTLTRLQQSL